MPLTHPHAIAAIHAVQNLPRWGRWATFQYLARRGVPISLFTLARVLHHAKETLHA